MKNSANDGSSTSGLFQGFDEGLTVFRSEAAGDLMKDAGGTAADRAAGMAMVIASLGTVFAMAHHPSGAHSGGLAGTVHGAMIALLLLMTWAFAFWSLRRGASRPLILAGLLAYAVSLFGHVGAATINGFVVPALAARGPGAAGHDVYLFAWEMNQALAMLGVYMTGSAYVLWSIDLFRDGNRSAQLTALLGLMAGAVPAFLLAAGLIRMNLEGAFIVYALHAGWAALIGVQLLFGRLAGPSRPAAPR